MLQSRYVVQAQGPQGEFLLYHTANGAFVELDPGAQMAWEKTAEDNTDAATESVQALAALGFLTQLSPEEEFALQRDSFAKQRVGTDEMVISIIPTYACNYRCPYCYEPDHQSIKGKMDGAMMDTLVEFLRQRQQEMGFTSLQVQWYGGEPTLALDVVEALSNRFMEWCDGEGISYDALMLTNANLIGEEEAQLLANCRVSRVLLTIEGPEEVHNQRRVAANGTNSYQRLIQAARYLRQKGVAVDAHMNADKVNLPLFGDLREKLLREEGIQLSFTKLNDYGHFFGEAPFCKPGFDLFDHEEFFRAQFQEFSKTPHSLAEIREMLRPARRFCAGQTDSYMVVDLLGDVYACDGWVGDKDYVIFNLHDDPSTWNLHEVSFDPTEDGKCRECELLPICWGNCIWERQLSGMPCHPFKTTMGDYLSLYREVIGDVVSQGEGGVTLLAPALSPEGF